VGRLARAYTKDSVRHEVAEPRLVIEEATHRFVPVDDDIKVARLVELLGEKRDLALVFVRTKRGADRLRKRLAATKVHAGAMHGDMSQGARRKALERFAAGRVDVLVATDVAARGLDLDGITHVINFDPPADRKDYVHRVGRTARAGRSGTGVTLVAPHQRNDVGTIARELRLHDEFQAEGLAMPKPQRVFTAHKRHSRVGRPRRRRA
jgi:ATP-dependent RNA helicase RhlE